MTFTQVNEVPKRKFKTEVKDLVETINQFMRMRVKIAKVNFAWNDYPNIQAGYSSLRGAIIRHKYPIIIEMVNGEVYLTRTDM